MNVATLSIDVEDAKAQYAAYKTACKSNINRQEPDVRTRLLAEHKAAQQILWHASKGRRILRLGDSMAIAGVNEKGWPKLAITRAHREFVFVRKAFRNETERWTDASAMFYAQSEELKPREGRTWKTTYNCDRVVMRLDGHKLEQWSHLRAVVPTIPPHLMPAGRLSNYHILWEAEWTPTAPKDPILLSRIDGDAFAVLAQWDLSEVERLVLQRRFK